MFQRQVIRTFARNARYMTNKAGTERLPMPSEKFRRAQEHFQIDNGVPVYLKGGMGDRILFATTVVLCVVGLFESFRTIYHYSMPKK